MISLDQDCHCADRDWSRETPKYMPEKLLLKSVCLVRFYLGDNFNY
jgi:hypothetical protein